MAMDSLALSIIIKSPVLRGVAVIAGGYKVGSRSAMVGGRDSGTVVAAGTSGSVLVEGGTGADCRDVAVGSAVSPI